MLTIHEVWVHALAESHERTITPPTSPVNGFGGTRLWCWRKADWKVVWFSMSSRSWRGWRVESAAYHHAL